MNKACFICDTPLQVFNAINIYIHERDSIGRADIIIVNQFKNAEIICRNLENINLFDKVILAQQNITDIENNSVLIHDIHRIIDMINPEIVVSRQLGIDRETTNEAVCYSKLYSSVLTKLVTSILQMNKGIEFYLYDDGIGSYIGDITKKATKKNQILSRVLRKGVATAKPLALYVNNVKFCNSTASSNILPIAKIDEKFLSVAREVFEWDQTTSLETPIIILTEPNETGRKHRIVSDILPVVQKYKERCIVRLHPRDSYKERYNGFNFDSQNIMWEMRVAMSIDFSNYILIGPNSTAQITPKLFFDKEPYLIFTHYFAEYLTHEDIKKYNKSIESIKEMYRKRDKIYCPKTVSEFDDAISTVLTKIGIG